MGAGRLPFWVDLIYKSAFQKKAFHDWKALRSYLTNIGDTSQRIGTGTATGYSPLTYLSARGITPMSTRYNQQAELLRALKDAKLDQYFKAAMEGQLLMS